ncbi:HU family DNA-binding protein [Candidatus Chlorohelix sp.]|uniref:HU family DNA-binding protein n=1 Tax=Candidatus Chlorohelix sp. TaxID=3139201 RepID=UPI003028316A
MHKNEFIKQIARETSLPQKQVNQVVKATIELIAHSLRNGDKVVLTGFGTFEVRTRRERQGVNPHTKERIVIPQTQTPGFTASNTLKNIVLGKAEPSLLSNEFDSNHNENEIPNQRRRRGRKNGV